MSTNNYKGRPVGAVNKVNKQVKEVIGDFITNNQPKFQEWFDELESIDKINIYLKMLPFVTPKMRSIEPKIEGVVEQPLFPIIDLGTGTKPLSDYSDEEFKKLNEEYREEEKRRNKGYTDWSDEDLNTVIEIHKKYED